MPTGDGPCVSSRMSRARRSVIVGPTNSGSGGSVTVGASSHGSAGAKPCGGSLSAGSAGSMSSGQSSGGGSVGKPVRGGRLGTGAKPSVSNAASNSGDSVPPSPRAQRVRRARVERQAAAGVERRDPGADLIAVEAALDLARRRVRRSGRAQVGPAPDLHARGLGLGRVAAEVDTAPGVSDPGVAQRGLSEERKLCVVVSRDVAEAEAAAALYVRRSSVFGISLRGPLYGYLANRP